MFREVLFFLHKDHCYSPVLIVDKAYGALQCLTHFTYWLSVSTINCNIICINIMMNNNSVLI